MIKIYTKRSFEFKNPKTDEKVQTAFMGFTPVPEWAAEDPMFKQGVKTGSIQIIQSAEQQKVLENGGEDSELTELRARAVELKIPRASQMGKDKLKAAIAEKDGGSGSNPDNELILEEMDISALTECAQKNNIDITGLTTEDEIRARIKESGPKE